MSRRSPRRRFAVSMRVARPSADSIRYSSGSAVVIWSMSTPVGSSRLGRRGQPGRPSAGVSATREDVKCRIPGRHHESRGQIVARWCDDGSVRQVPETSSIPDRSGVYVFRDAKGTSLYVGKALSLRSRLANYFADPATLPERTAHLVASAASVDWTVTASEVDALLLENSLIKADQPRFNVRLKDDKSYPHLAIDLRERWPRPIVARGRRRRGVRYFGPFGHAKSLRSTIDLLLPTFPVRTCSDAKFVRHERLGRPCLLADIGRCSAPCVGRVDDATYAEHVQGILRFFGGDADALTRDLRARMQAAAEAQDYEAAARLRDALVHVEHASASQQVLLSERDDLDAVGAATAGRQAGVVRPE